MDYLSATDLWPPQPANAQSTPSASSLLLYPKAGSQAPWWSPSLDGSSGKGLLPSTGHMYVCCPWRQKGQSTASTYTSSSGSTLMFNVLAIVINIFIGPDTTERQWFYILSETCKIKMLFYSKRSFGFTETKQSDFWTWNRQNASNLGCNL